MFVFKKLSLIAIIIGAGALGISSTVGATSVILVTNSTLPAVGETLDVDIIANIDPGDEIIGFGFDPVMEGTGILTFDGFTPNRPVFGDDPLFLAPVSDADGIRGAAEGSLLYGSPVSGSSLLLGTLRFTVSGPGDLSIGIGADDLTAYATEGLIPASGSNFMPLVSPLNISPVPVPGTIFLLGGGLLGLAGFVRRSVRR